MPKTWSDWIALVGGLIAILIVVPTTLRDWWRDRPRIVIECDYADNEPIGVTTQKGATLEQISEPGSHNPTFELGMAGQEEPRLAKGKRRTLIVTIRNLGRRPVRLEKIAFLWLDQRSKASRSTLGQAEPFNYVLAEDARRATYVADLPQYRRPLAVCVVDDSGEEHVVYPEQWPADMAPPRSGFCKKL